MSHFAVLVIGENPKKQLAPYHEFECTGNDDEFVKDIDITEEVRAEYEKSTISMLRDNEGKLYSPYDDRFYREPTLAESKKVGIGSGWAKGISFTSKDWGDGKGYRPKVHFIPEGMEQVTVPHKDLKTFIEYVKDYEGKELVPFGEKLNLTNKHKYGYALIDAAGNVEKIIKRTNPNDKWDWHQVGGRFSGTFKLKDGSVSDQALKKDIDFSSMVLEKKAEAAERYDKLKRLLDDEIPKLDYVWKEVLEGERFKELNINEKRAIYHDQEPIKKVDQLSRSNSLSQEDKSFLSWLDYESYLCGRDEYISRAGRSAISTFAVVKDGQWYERGEMGWWATVHNEKDQEVWNIEFEKLLESVAPETLLTVIDCHI